MAKFSASEMAFTGFRIAKRQPVTVAIWTVLLFVLSVGFGVWFAGVFGPVMWELQAKAAETGSDPAETLALLQKAAPGYALMTVGSLILYPVVYAAGARAVLRPEENRFGYLRLGGDEINQFVLFLLIFALALGAYIALIIAAVLVVVAAVFVGKALGGTGVGALALVPLLSLVAIFAGVIYAMVRLSLASAMTFDTGRLQLRTAWKLTRGQFWPMLGSYLLVWLFTMVLFLGMAAISGVLFFLSPTGRAFVQSMFASMRGVGAVVSQPPDIMAMALSPPILLASLVGSAVYVVIFLMWLTAPAAIYQALRPEPAAAP